MYNRYIPQSDGSYRKNRIPDSNPEPPHPQQKQANKDDTTPIHSTSVHEPPQSSSVTGFLRNLLPKEFDTGDLLVVLLLLLMAERREEDQNTALLTLALYFFM